MKDSNQYIETLLLKQLHGELSAEEQHDLEQWLNASAENREEYKTLMRIWEASLSALDHQAFDTTTAWTKINEDLRTRVIPMQPTAGRRRRMAGPLKWIVAASILLCTAGWWYVNTHQQPKEKTIIAADGNRIITLPDSTTIYLRKGSTITYPETLANGRGDRMATLKGEAFFEVRHNPANPFRIGTSQATIEDLGTSFLIRQKDSVCQVLVTAGMVRCTARTSPAGVLVVAAGERGLLSAGSWTRCRQSDPNVLAWKSHTLEFNQSPLDSVLAAVHDLYGVPVTMAAELHERSANIRITARFNAHEQLQDVLAEIRLMTGLGMQQKNDTTILFQK